jgi:competence protein ComEC
MSLVIIVPLLLFYTKNRPQKLEIDFLDVGQGDASLIKLPNKKFILIDGGPDNLVLKRLGESLPFYQRKIDLIIISHFHDDHITGLIELMNRYEISRVIYMRGDEDSGGQNSPELWKIFMAKARAKKIDLLALESRATIEYFPGCGLKIINPLRLSLKKDANNSLVVKLNCQSLSALFTGDNSLKVENALLKTAEDWSAKILKASHHGSKSANSEIFFQAVRPSLLFISVGVDNRFGHPSPEIIERASRLGIKIKRTDEMGTLRVF